MTHPKSTKSGKSPAEEAEGEATLASGVTITGTCLVESLTTYEKMRLGKISVVQSDKEETTKTDLKIFDQNLAVAPDHVCSLVAQANEICPGSFPKLTAISIAPICVPGVTVDDFDDPIHFCGVLKVVKCEDVTISCKSSIYAKSKIDLDVEIDAAASHLQGVLKSLSPGRIFLANGSLKEWTGSRVSVKAATIQFLDTKKQSSEREDSASPSKKNRFK